MTNELQTRLRAFVSEVAGTHFFGHMAAPIQEAADALDAKDAEIERLRAEVEVWRNGVGAVLYGPDWPGDLASGPSDLLPLLNCDARDLVAAIDAKDAEIERLRSLLAPPLTEPPPEAL